ncbi:hypothetical protein RHIZ404_20008 [Rhizobium sp. EC-SD404]|nr:hypothetical protein RHIZ404_20008 [Rhizobium sp. EC-SD404]
MLTLMVDIETIAAHLASDTTISDNELILLIRDLRAATEQQTVVELEKYKIRKVLEACATFRDLEVLGLPAFKVPSHRR